MAAEDGSGYEFGCGGGVVASALDGVEGIEAVLNAMRLVRGVGIVPLRCLRVELPAVIVDALALRFELREEGLDVGEGFVFEALEADYDIGDLNAGVVDVVLDVDLLAGGAEKADEGVSQDGVAEMADMGGLVGVDAGVLDDDVSGLKRGFDSGAGGDGFCGGRAFEAGVDVSGSGDFECGEAFDGA